MKTASIFDYSPPVAELPPEPMPTRINKRIMKEGKLIYVAVERKVKWVTS